MTVFLRCIEDIDKALALKRLRRRIISPSRLVLPAERLRQVPTSPFAYWVSDRIRNIFTSGTVFEDEERVVRQGLSTSDDFRFIRSWYEVAPENGWISVAKGGRRSTFYGDITSSVNWREDGAEVKAFAETTPGTLHWSRRMPNVAFYFRPGISWPLRGKEFSAQAVPAGSVFTIAGKMAFASMGQLLPMLAIMNSRPFDRLMGLFAGSVGAVQYEAGLISRTPYPALSADSEAVLSQLGRTGWSLRRQFDTANEVSHAFVMPSVLQVDGESFRERINAWSDRVGKVDAEVGRVQAEINELCFDLYEISEKDRQVITNGFGVSVEDEPENSEDDDDDNLVTDADPAALAAGLMSWAVGVTVGRFDVRFATCERKWPDEPNPFDPLPVSSPGMLTGEAGLPLHVPPAGYPVSVSPVLVDDPGHELDIATRGAVSV